MKAYASLVAWATATLTVTNALAGGYPLLFVPGIDADGWQMWGALPSKLPTPQAFRHVPAGDFVDCSQDEPPSCTPFTVTSVPSNSYWYIDYYRRFQNGKVDRPVGKIGNPKTGTGLVLRDQIPGEEAVWGNGLTYNTTRSYAEELGTTIDHILAATGAQKVDIVAHSMGGLVTRAYINWYGGASKVRKVLFIGTPNNGVSDVAEHGFQYGLKVHFHWDYPFINVDEGRQPELNWQRIGETLEMYPKLVDSFTFDNESDPPSSILPKHGPLPSYQGRSWLAWLNQGRVVASPVEYATIAGWYRDELVRLAKGDILANICVGYHQAGCCLIVLGACWGPTPGACDCCGATLACVSRWDLITEMLQGRPIPDDIAVNLSEVPLSGAVFNDIDYAYHIHLSAQEAPFLAQVPLNNILTESDHTAERIKTWILQDQTGLRDYTSPDVKTSSSSNQGGDSAPSYSVRSSFPALPAINPDISNQRLSSLQSVPPEVSSASTVPYARNMALQFVPPGYSFDVKQMIPDQGPAGAPYQETTPAFFLQPMQSNAQEVYAVDYQRPSDSAPLGGVLIELTEGSLYSHDFPTCARYAGYSLDNISCLKIDDGWYYEATLSRLGESVYSISMYLVLDAIGGATVDSAWIGDDVPVTSGLPVLNVQVWTVAPADTSALASQVISRARTLIPGLTFVNSAPKEVPRVYFRTASTTVHAVLVDLHKTCAIERVNMEQVLYPQPDASSSYSVATSFWLEPGIRPLHIGQPDIDSAVIYVRTTGSSGDGPRDKIYINRTRDPCALDPKGWWSYNDADSGGNSTVQVTTPVSSTVPNPIKTNVLFEVPSSAHMEGVVSTAFAYGFVGMGISLSMCQQAVDMSGAASISLMVRGDGKQYRMRLETASVTDYDYYGVVFNAPVGWELLTFPISALSQEGWGNPVPWTGTDVLRLSFQTVGQPLSSVSLDVSDAVVSYAGAGPAGPLQIYGMVPIWCFNDRECSLTLVGNQFDQNTQVTLGGQVLATYLLSASHLAANVPPGLAAGMYDVTIVPSAGPVLDLGSIMRIDDGAVVTTYACPGGDQCHNSGACDMATGLCTNAPKTDGTPCVCSDPCATGGACSSGVCVGTHYTCDGGSDGGTPGDSGRDADAQDGILRDSNIAMTGSILDCAVADAAFDVPLAGHSDEGERTGGDGPDAVLDKDTARSSDVAIAGAALDSAAGDVLDVAIVGHGADAAAGRADSSGMVAEDGRSRAVEMGVALAGDTASEGGELVGVDGATGLRLDGGTRDVSQGVPESSIPDAIGVERDTSVVSPSSPKGAGGSPVSGSGRGGNTASGAAGASGSRNTGSGCGCRLASANRPEGPTLLVLAGVALALTQRRRRPLSRSGLPYRAGKSASSRCPTKRAVASLMISSRLVFFLKLKSKLSSKRSESRKRASLSCGPIRRSCRRCLIVHER